MTGIYQMGDKFQRFFQCLFFSFGISISQGTIAQEHQQPQYQDLELLRAPKTLFSIDGGGIRGLWSLKIIENIETHLEAPITDFVDCFTGSSIGGILALGYATGHTTAELQSLLFDNKEKIFTRKSSWWRIFNPLITEKYETKPLEDLVQEFFGETKMGDLKKHTIITSCNITKTKAEIFCSYEEKYQQDPVWFVARSTSAAPTFFDPTKYHGDALADGGLVANNPTYLAATLLNGRYGRSYHTQHNREYLQDLGTISVGTGMYDPGITYEKAQNMGVLQWASPISTTLIDTNSNDGDMLCRNLLNDHHYMRLSTVFSHDMPLDGISAEQMDNLNTSAQDFIKKNQKGIKKAAKILRRKKKH